MLTMFKSHRKHSAKHRRCRVPACHLPRTRVHRHCFGMGATPHNCERNPVSGEPGSIFSLYRLENDGSFSLAEDSPFLAGSDRHTEATTKPMTMTFTDPTSKILELAQLRDTGLISSWEHDRRLRALAGQYRVDNAGPDNRDGLGSDTR